MENTLNHVLAMTGCKDAADLIDMAKVGSSLMSTIEVHSASGPLKNWHPANDPAEVVGDLVNMLEEQLPFAKGTVTLSEALTVSRHFSLPEEIEGKAALLIRDWQNPLMFSLSESLQDLGIEASVAVHVEVNTLMVWACRISYLACRVIERREPSAERWALACADDYAATEKWFAENYNDVPPVLHSTEGVASCQV